MTRYLIVLSIIYLSFSTNLYSQRCNLSVSGKITDLHDESPIIGALVFIEGTNNFSQTDENGEYLIEEICFGPIQLKVEHPSCNGVKKKLDIKKEKNYKL
jgi:iron complex outermembrane receptor protein